MLVNFSGVQGFLVSEKKDGFVVFTSSRKRAIHKKSVIYVQSYCIAKSVNVFSTKVLIGDATFTSPNGDGTAISRGHLSNAKVSPLAEQRKYLHFSVILRP